jgi:hypothetical protein
MSSLVSYETSYYTACTSLLQVMHFEFQYFIFGIEVPDMFSVFTRGACLSTELLCNSAAIWLSSYFTNNEGRKSKSEALRQWAEQALQ